MLATWGCTTFPKPTLSLDFLGATSLDSGITFSRGSQATLFDSAGTLRYAKHNLLVQSQTFQTTWTTSTATVSADAGIAPDSTLTADKVIPDNAATGRVQQTFTTATGFTYTFSCFVKADGFGWVALGMSAPGAYFNLSGAGAVGTTPAGYTASITSVGSGWYRCVVTLTESGGASRTWRINPASADNTLAVGDGTSGILVWGAQLNLANMEGGVTSSLTTYYPTTTAAYYAPRFDYNPSTLQPRGLLIEEQRTNSILQSEDFATTWVATSATITTNAIVSPSGLITADKMIVDNGVSSGSSSLHQEVTKAASSITYTLSMFAKKGEADTLRLLPRDTATSANNADARFNLDAGTVISVAAAGTFTSASAAIQNIGNGWYRCSMTFTSGTEISIRNRIYQQKAGANFTGNGTDGIYIWGYQFEAGAFATSYIPTTTTALTRNADVATMTGTNFSSWYNQTEGTFFAQASSASTTANIVGSSDGTNNNRVVLGTNTGPNSRLLMTTLGSLQASVSVAYTLNTVAKFAGAYKLNSSNFASNGTLGIEDTVCTIPTVDRLSIGTNTTATDFFLNGWISRIAYYPTRLPNATLQALTA